MYSLPVDGWIKTVIDHYRKTIPELLLTYAEVVASVNTHLNNSILFATPVMINWTSRTFD
jgi:hypothetical protein